jgi:hypothetical protein
MFRKQEGVIKLLVGRGIQTEKINKNRKYEKDMDIVRGRSHDGGSRLRT